MAEFAAGGLGVIGLGFLVKVGLDQANKQQKRSNGSQGHDYPSSRDDGGPADPPDWTYVPPSS
jgi:hypothetical protein